MTHDVIYTEVEEERGDFCHLFQGLEVEAIKNILEIIEKTL